MEKVAGKPLKDPNAEHLRKAKERWNQNTSLFIDNLINLKKLMNGRESKFSNQKSHLTQELPSDPSQILATLSGNFATLVQQGNVIIEEQLAFSETKKHKKAFLIKEASNPFSRGISYLKGPWFGANAKISRYRKNLLSSLAKAKSDLNHLQAVVLGSSKESIEESYHIFYNLTKDLDLIAEGVYILEQWVNQLPKKELSEGDKKPEENKPNDKIPDLKKPRKNVELDKLSEEELKLRIERAMALSLDYNKYFNLLPDTIKSKIDDKQKSEMIHLYNMYRTSDYGFRVKVENTVKLEYNYLNIRNQVIHLLSAPNSEESFEDLFNYWRANNKTAALNKFANNYIDKFLGKIKHKISPFDKTSSHRLYIAERAEAERTLVNKLMDALEKMSASEKDFSIDIRVIKETLNEIIKINDEILKRFSAIRYLGEDYDKVNKRLDRKYINQLVKKF